MPKVRLYNHDVRFHTANGCNPLQFTAAAYCGHTAWTRLTPMVVFQTNLFSANMPSEFRNMATRFAALGLTGTYGETGPDTWDFSTGTTAERTGLAVVYALDMYRAFFASRGISHDGRHAWWPQNAGDPVAGNAYHNSWALYPKIDTSTVLGSTADSLQLYTWTGSTATQAAVLADSIYVDAGVVAFAEWSTDVGKAISTSLTDNPRPGVRAPDILAGDHERATQGSVYPFFYGEDNNVNNEMGSWIQALNDPRATSYLFFDRYTLRNLWGSAGGFATAFRSPHQRSQPYTITACDGSGALKVESNNVDIIWSQRINYLDYTPDFYNFYSSFLLRCREHVWHKAWLPYQQYCTNTIVGNYKNVPSTRKYPNRSVGKIAGYNYTCDITLTGPDSENGYEDINVTGTFSLDYASPALYVKSGDSQSTGYANWIPGYAYKPSSPILKNYLGNWGAVQTLERIGSELNSGLFSRGNIRASYTNFLQHCSKQGITGFVGGGTAEGYTGGNILDLRNLWLQTAKNQLDSVRYSLDMFDDNASKPTIPWIGAFANVYPSIFSLTSSWAGDETKYPDVNGLTNFSVPVYSPLYLDYNVAVIKYAIQNHGVADFLVFESGGLYGLTTGVQSLNFWNDVLETLILDSQINNAPVARINVSPGNDVRDTDGNGERIFVSGLSSTDTENNILVYNWTTNNGLSASGPTASFLFTAGTYDINLLVIDSVGATGATTTNVLVRSNTAPSAVINSSRGFSVIDQDENGFENFVFSGASSSDAYDGSIMNYLWNVDGLNSTTGSTLSTSLAIGLHTINLIVTDNGNLTAGDTKIVNVDPLPKQKSKFASMIFYGENLYTREQYDYLLKTLYNNFRI